MILDDDVETLDRNSANWLAQRLHMDPRSEAQRSALSYVFHATQQSYTAKGRSKRQAKEDTAEYLYQDLELPSHVFKQFVDSIFPVHDKVNRDALSIALICNDALEQAAEEDRHIPFGAFDEYTYELARTFFDEANDLIKNGAAAFTAGIEPESLFLAHIFVIKSLSRIENTYTQVDPRALMRLEDNFFKPVSEILLEDNGLGRQAAGYLRALRHTINEYQAEYTMFGVPLVGENDNGWHP